MPNQPAKKDDPLRGKKTGGWSKYGNARYGLVREDLGEEWSCQACGNTIPRELKPFLYEIYKDEYIRMCNKCLYESKKISNEQNFTVYRRVIKIVRKG